MELVLEQLATHVPDLVIRKPLSVQLPQTVHSYGVIVFADISGFTALCEKYTSGVTSKENAADQLTTTLNSYLSKIVEVVLEAGGDVLKFAGDALLAFWSCSRFSVAGMLEHVLSACLSIQENFDYFRTQDGEVLRMKIGLSSGKVDLHYIGNKSVRLYDVTGPAIEDSNTAQHHTKSGAVVISKMAWECISKERCVAEVVGPGFAQVSELREDVSIIVPHMGASPKARKTLDLSGSSTKARTKSQDHSPSRTWKWSPKDKSPGQDVTSLKSSRTGLTRRYKIKEVLPLLPSEVQDELRTYILPTVLHKIEHGHDSSWFSELREVSVLFINLNPGARLGPSQTLSLLQNSFDVIYPSLNKYNATLNKVFMFDKGCTFLCIFGLPHTRHESNTCSALRAARDIFNALEKQSVERYTSSIGVTTGVAFCGVVGHPQRHEYTVIGQKVNMAARLMMKFPGCITCDETTKTKSTLSNSQFTLAPQTTLKGISNPENIYKFSSECMEALELYNWDVHKATDADDLIGRHKEMQIFLDELVHVSEHTTRATGVIVITGVGGIGKTKLLRAMKAKAATMNFRVVSGFGGMIEQNTPFFTVKTLVAKLLHIDNSKNVHEREQLLLNHVTEPEMRELLPLLNDLLVLKLPQTPTTAGLLNPKDRSRALHKLLLNLVHQEALMKPCVFGIDDAHWIDPDSWNFLIDLEREDNAILILTTRPLERMIKKPPAFEEILNHPNTKVIHLQGLNNEEIVALTCKQLRVDTIPAELKDIIQKRSHGVPLWCEELIRTMLELNYLKIVESRRKSSNAEPQIILMNMRRHSDGSGLGPRDVPIPDSVTGMVLARIDHMSASDQITLKCASVIGTVFTKTMLHAILPNSTTMAFYNSLQALADVGIIECAILAQVRSLQADKDMDETELPSSLECPCLDNATMKNQPHHPAHKHHTSIQQVDNCETLQFVHNYMQETAYNLCTEAQRKTLHTSAAQFLENHAHKCKSCGGGDFIGGRTASIIRKNRKYVTRTVYVGAGGTRLQNKRASVSSITQSIESTPIKPLTGLAAVPGPSTLGTSLEVGGSSIPSSESCNEAERRRTSSTASIKLDARNLSVNSLKLSTSSTMMEVETCHCDEVLAKVYPQLVRHWRAAGDLHNTMLYLIEEASAAVATFNNMEALSLLQEAKEIYEGLGKGVVSNQELGRMQSLVGQTLYQMGQVEKSMDHFYEALHLLDTRLPKTMLGGGITLVYHTLKQFKKVKGTSNIIAQLNKDEPFLDRARCLAHISHAYHLKKNNTMSLMTILKRLNEAHHMQDYINEVMEAYAAMIEHCQRRNFSKLANHYFNRAMAFCEDIDLGVEDVRAYTHLLFVGFSLKLYQGNLTDALSIGTAAYNAIKRKHDPSMEFSTLPLLFFTSMACFNRSNAMELLKEFSEVASECDDLRAQALYDCCHFDGLLEFGIDWQDENRIVTRALLCYTDQDVYYYDETERYFLMSCHALWHARKENSSCDRYFAAARDLQPKKFSNYLAAKAHSRFVETSLLIMRKRKTKESILQAKKAIKKLKLALSRFGVLEPRYLHFKAYYHLIKGCQHKAQHYLSRAYIEANRCGCLYDAEWCLRSKKAWFPDTTLPYLQTQQEETEDNEDTVFIFVFQPLQTTEPHTFN